MSNPQVTIDICANLDLDHELTLDQLRAFVYLADEANVPGSYLLFSTYLGGQQQLRFEHCSYDSLEDDDEDDECEDDCSGCCDGCMMDHTEPAQVHTADADCACEPTSTLVPGLDGQFSVFKFANPIVENTRAGRPNPTAGIEFEHDTRYCGCCY